MRNANITSNVNELSSIQKLFLALLFVVFAIVGLSIAGDYGVSWDDELQTSVGKQNYEFAIGTNASILKSHDKYYGSAFELPVYFVQSFFYSYPTQIYVRHIITHFFFLFALFVFFKLILRFFKSYWLAILGVLFLYLSPRIFAHSFFNTKDIPFMSAFIISIYTMLRVLEKPSDIKAILVHALTSAFIIDIRIIGFLVPALSLFIFVYAWFQSKYRFSIFKLLAFYSVTLIVLIILFWPVLWAEPLNIFRSFIRMAQFPWRYENLFNGGFVKAINVPWYYIPTWIGITTSIFMLLLYFIGSVEIIVSIFKNIENAIKIKKVFLLILMFLPIDLWILFIIINSTFYDAWRHLFFFYPLIIIGAIYGLQAIINAFENQKVKFTTLLISGLFLIMPLLKIIELHPNQQIYFNAFVNKDKNSIRKNWEMDYWGLSYKEAFEKLKEKDGRPIIKIYVINDPGVFNAKLVDNDKFIIVGKIEDADYFISNYRFHPADYPYQKIDGIIRHGSEILGIYKIEK